MAKPQRHLVFADCHVPHSVDLVKTGTLRWAKTWAPTHFILLGDFLDLAFASHWSDPVFKKMNMQRWVHLLEQEFSEGKKTLELICNHLPDNCIKTYVIGNHEKFAWDLALNHKLISTEIKIDKLSFKTDIAKMARIGTARIIKKQLDLDRFGFNVLPHGAIYRVGNIHYCHGDQFGSVTASRNQFPGRNLVMGHWHCEQTLPLHNSGDTRKAFQHRIIPGLTHLSPGYLSSGATTWLQGFGVCDVLENGLFDFRVKKILNGQLAPKL